MDKQTSTLNRRLADAEQRRDALIEIGSWVWHTCLIMGTELHTAYAVADAFVCGLERELAARDAHR